MKSVFRHRSFYVTRSLSWCLLLIGLVTGGTIVFAERPVVAVLGFTGATNQQAIVAATCTSILTDALVKSDNFELIKAEAVVSALDSGGGVAVFEDQSVVNRLGTELGCQYVVYGEVTNTEVDNHRFSGYGVTTYKTAYHLSVNLKVMDIYRKRIVFTRSLENSSVSTVNVDRSPGFVAREFTKMVKAPFQKVISPLEKALLKDIEADAEGLTRFSGNPGQNSTFPKNHVIQFKCNVPTALVEVDGVVEGTCEQKITLTVGVHEVSIAAVGYIPSKFKIRVSKEMTFSVELLSLDNSK